MVIGALGGALVMSSRPAGAPAFLVVVLAVLAAMLMGILYSLLLAVALALADHLLDGRGACRVHGGGFAGTIQAFVPMDMLEDFRAGMEAVLGEGSCHVLSIRPEGGILLEEVEA